MHNMNGIPQNLADNEMESFQKSRKRTRNPLKHKINQHKLKVQRGEERTTKLKLILKKTFNPQTSCRCKKNCSQLIGISRQREIFNSFYGLKNSTQKTLFLRTLAKKITVKDNLNPIIALKNKNYVNKYYLYDSFGRQQQVCLGFLLTCLQINTERIRSALNSVVTNEIAKDFRGGLSHKKTEDCDASYVKQFIDQFPRYESHYKVARSNIKYLSPFWNIKRLYREYCIKYNFEYKNKPDKKPVSEWKFRNIFNTQFNLSFARLKVDTCGTCDKFNAEIKNEKDLVRLHDLEYRRQAHWNLVKKLSIEFDDELKASRDQANKTEIFTFDLQRALEMPVLRTGEAYYKRQLWFYNLCVYDNKRGIAYMYVWHEAIASRGAQEISSCLIKHFMTYVPVDTHKIILNSDSCSGQNRNIKMSLMLKNFLSNWKHPELKSIEQHFFIPGHSYNACDRSFGTIELQKRKTEDIFIPQHWINVIRQAKKTEPKFIVVEMSKQDFFSSKSLEKSIINRKNTISGDKINWFRFQKIIYDRENPLLLKVVEYGFNNDVLSISLQKRSTHKVFQQKNLKILFPNGRFISKAKYNDLNKLIKNIPAEFHRFYRSLKTDESSNDYGLALRVSSDESDEDNEI